jgi:integrase
VLRGGLASGEARGVFHGVISKLVPKFRAKHVPRETYLTPEQFSRLLRNIVAPPHPNAKPETVAKVERRRINRTLYCVLIALASPRRGELEKLQREHVQLVRGAIMVAQGRNFTGLCRAPASRERPVRHRCARRNPTTPPIDPLPLPRASIRR